MVIGAWLAAATIVAVLAAPRVLSRGHPVRKDSAARVPAPGAALSGADSPATPAANVEQLAAQLAAGRAVIGGLAFIGATDTLESSSELALTRLAKALVATAGTFLIEAHVPPSRDVLADQSLTDRRAAVVRTRLIAAGVPATRLLAMGFGATRASSTSPQARIELSLMP